MKNILFIIIIPLILQFLFPKYVLAIYDPLAVPNNKYGIHILDENDLDSAAELINSNGGDWGYVTIVIRADERQLDRWQGVFDKMRKLHIIPIVRIASRQSGGIWEKPSIDDVENWVYFLNSLNWVVMNRYVIIGNEPNHASEWGGEVNPKEYSSYLSFFSRKLKDASKNFFLLPAGFDASAPDNNGYMSEVKFLSEMIKEHSDIFEGIDGWVSHSYPNPNFSGSPYEKGVGTINTFNWEMEILSSLGVKRQFPIFITETGWSSENLNESIISDYYNYSFQNVWDGDQVAAITPFVLNYTNPPFNYFSWKNNDGSFKLYYETIKSIRKTSGKPYQISSGKISIILLSDILKSQENNINVSVLYNSGQSIWIKNKINLVNIENSIGSSYLIPLISDIYPGHGGIVLHSPYQTF